MNATALQQLKKNVDNTDYQNPTKTYTVPATTNPDGTLNIPAQPVYGIDPNHEPIDAYMAVRMVPGGTLNSVAAAVSLVAAGFPLTVPANKKWAILSFVCDVTTTATVGNRIIQCSVSANAVGGISWRGAPLAALAASLTGGYDVGFGPPLNTPSTAVRRNIGGTANTSVQMRENTSITQLGPGGEIRILDSAGIDITDVLTYRIVYVEYDA